jgi:hypothetical protein
MEKKKTISVVAIAMALTIVFSGVALASQPVPPTKETEILDITTDIVCSGSVVESQWLSLKMDSINLPVGSLVPGEIYGEIKYGEKMIGLSGDTEFDKCLKVDTSKTTPNLDVHKQIGYTAGPSGSLGHFEWVEMEAISAGKTTTKTTTTGPFICPFDKPDTKTTTTKVPGSCEEVHAFSGMFVTNVQAATTTAVGITEAPVNLNYRINAKGDGLVIAGVGLDVDDGIGGTNSSAIGSRMAYREMSIAWGEFEFTKEVGYKSKPPT